VTVDPVGRDEPVVFALPRRYGHGVSDLSPDVWARMFKDNDLDEMAGTLEAFSQDFEDSARGNDIRWPGLIHRFETRIQCVDATGIAWEIDLARLVDHDEAERWELAILLLRQVFMNA